MSRSTTGSIDYQIRVQLFEKFTNGSFDEKKYFLKQWGIVLGGIYVGQYSKSTNRIKIDYLTNPFNNKALEAVPGEKGHYTEAFPIAIKLSIDEKKLKYDPDTIFIGEMVGGYLESSKAEKFSSILEKAKEKDDNAEYLEKRNKSLLSDNIELRKRLAECDASKLQTELRETKSKLQQLADKRQGESEKRELKKLKSDLHEYKLSNNKLQTYIKELLSDNANLRELLQKERKDNQDLEKTIGSHLKINADLQFQLDEERSLAKTIIERDIYALLHVTRIENLNSILQNGIVPLTQLKTNAARNDLERYDRKPNCSSLSITRFNSRYFGKAALRDAGQTFVCIYIRPSILLDNNTKYYCHHNAASSSISCATGKGYLTAAKDFEYMFADTIEYQTVEGTKVISRKNNYRDNWTTSDQAEILYEGIINPAYFLGVAFPSENALKNAIKLLERYKLKGIVDETLNF